MVGEKSFLFYFKSGVFTYDVHKKTAEKFAKAPKICIWCEKEKISKISRDFYINKFYNDLISKCFPHFFRFIKDFECEFCPSTKEYRDKFLTHMQVCLRDQTFKI